MTRNPQVPTGIRTARNPSRWTLCTASGDEPPSPSEEGSLHVQIALRERDFDACFAQSSQGLLMHRVDQR